MSSEQRLKRRRYENWGGSKIEKSIKPFSYILRFAVAVAIVEFFAYKVLDPYYLQFMTTERGLNLSPIEFGFFVSFTSIVTVLQEYLSGIFADKFGRRLVWAIGLLMYGSGMIWLSSVSSFEYTFITAALMGSSYAFTSGSKEAWLYDYTGKDGMKRAYGLLYLLSIPLTIIGGGMAILLGQTFHDIRIPIAVTGLIIICNAIFIITFSENYGGRTKNWIEIGRAGVKQFMASRVLQLTVLQSLLMTLPIWINTAWWVTYVVKEFHIEITETALVFAIVSISGAITGLYILKMKSTNYKQLIVYPTILMVSAYLMMPFSHNLITFVLLVIGALIGSYFRGAGITILENEMITTERATSLSFLNMIRDMSWGAIPILWGILMQAISLKTTFILAGIFSFVSFVMLMVALRIRGEKNEQDRGA